MRLSRACILSMSSVALGLIVAPAGAASLTGPVTGWASGVPSYISMYEYIPSNVVASPPIVVGAHYCGGSASAFFSMASGVVAAADKYGFIMIFPQTTNPATSAKCWDVGSKASLTHDGGGDTQAIAQMVKYEISKRNANANRVYIMGASSGAMLTEAMLAVYPDVFKAGSEFSGVPAGCWSAGWSAASNWGNTCATGQDIQTAQQWGDLVRAMYPGYSGFRPRVQLWHGTADTTINYQNQLEAIKEWTNVLGLNATPDSDVTSGGYEVKQWKNSCGFVVLDAHTQNGGGHTTPIDATSVVTWFGLDKTSATDPQMTACGGASGNGGASSAGGTTGAGGAKTGGAPSTGGTFVAVGGSSGFGGATAAGGKSSVGGGIATGGLGIGGNLPTGGKPATGGNFATGDAAATGGLAGVGGSTGGATASTGGKSSTSVNTTSATGGSTAVAGSGDSTGGRPVSNGGDANTAGETSTTPGGTADTGSCSCNVPGAHGPRNLLALAIAWAAIAMRGRRRPMA